MSDTIFTKNYFEIFSQAVGTQLDIELLKQKNRELQQQSHPDRFANGSDAEKRQAMQITSLINEAFDVLKNPVSRLQYMLTMNGIDMNADTDTSMDGLFLMEQMELREEISDIRSQADPLDVLETLSVDLKNKSLQLINEFETFFKNDDFDKGREIVRKLQFLNKAQKEISEITETLEDELI